jgi:phosphonate transport system substrate-binding protein
VVAPIVDRRAILMGTLTLLPCVAAGSPSAAAPIRVGLTPVFLSSDLELTGRLAAYLEKATTRPVELVTRRTYQEVTAMLVAGQLDAAWICGFPFVAHRSELQLVATPVWRGQPLYRAYVIVDRDRKAGGIAALRGDIHAYSDPDSNSGFLCTRAALAELGERSETFFSRSFFTYGHRNVIEAVSSGLAASGSVDGYVYDVVSELEPKFVARTRVLRTSEWLGFPPIAAPASPPDAGRLNALKAALLGMDGDADGRAVLALLKLDRFASEPLGLYDAIAAKAAMVAAAG